VFFTVSLYTLVGNISKHAGNISTFAQTNMKRTTRAAIVVLSLLTYRLKLLVVGAMMTVKAFAAKPFVQRAIASPKSPTSVLSFFFGVDTTTSAGIEELRHGTCLSSSSSSSSSASGGGMMQLWFGGGAEYDDLCKPFTETVRMAGRRELPWNTSVDGLMAQMLLTDQFARNIFRGSTESFSFEDVSLDVSRVLAGKVWNSNKNDGDGEIYPPYLAFIGTALMHSESIEDHDMCARLIDNAMADPAFNSESYNYWDYERKTALEHRGVIEQFGRYPHRNTLKGRESSEAERGWLADVDQLPGWAKSQAK
jgi:uncharacterized protein (DUF924 family)